MIDGQTELIAHIGYPTHTFKSPLIYNPYFEHVGINAVVVPMACQAADFAAFLPHLFRLSNLRGALITMPHKVAVVELLDRVSPAVKVAGACNAVKRLPSGELVGDLFDGTGFVRALLHKGLVLQGARVLVVGCGGVGRAIAASLAAAGVGQLALFDQQAQSALELAERVLAQYPQVSVSCGSNDPTQCDLVVNATPLGMQANDPLPIDIDRLASTTFVGEVVLSVEKTAFLRAAAAKGCRYQVGTDMLFAQIPAYLEFFGFPATTAEHLRALARLPH